MKQILYEMGIFLWATGSSTSRWVYMYVSVYVTTFSYLSMCKPMSAWVSPYLTVLVFAPSIS